MDFFYVYMYLRANGSAHGKAGSPYYVGKGKGMRAYDKSHRCKPPSDPLRIVFVVRDISENAAHAEEKRLIALYGRIDNGTGCLANLTDGGEGQCGAKWSPEVIEKRASKMRGRSRPAFSEEWKRHLSEAHLGLPSNRKGKKCSLETRKKIGDSKRGRIVSENQREKISKALTGKKRTPFSEEHRRKLGLSKMGNKFHFGHKKNKG